MKAFILAAGSGTRLRPLTDSVPKCLLPIQGVPLLEIWLENCHAAGIRDVLVNVHAHPERFREFVQTWHGSVRVHIVEERELLGSAGTLLENRGFVEDEEAFFVLYGDVLTNVSLAAMMDFHREGRMAATLGIYEVPDPSRCGIVTTDRDGVVRGFVEKPAEPESHWAFSGVMIASTQILDITASQRPADIGFHLLPRLIGRMKAYRIPDYLLDIGTLKNYNEAQVSWPGLRLAGSHQGGQAKAREKAHE
jgi:mannose-1-phosphate guanylyltransferase